MAQWQELQSLANTSLEQVHQLYSSVALPMEVRQCLADWIEDQNWRQAAEPHSSHAQMLFHSLLALLGDHLGSPGLGDEDFMLKHNLRKARRDLQAAFEECPEKFANLVANLLQEEQQILRLAQAGQQGGVAPAPSTPQQSDRQQEIQRRLADFQAALQDADRAFRHLEDAQDMFDFCYKVHYLPGENRTNDPEYIRQMQGLQAKLQKLDRSRKDVLAQMQQLLGRSETLQDFLQQELGAWRERQQSACLGAHVDTSLLQLETWFTALGEGLFQLLQLLRALGDLRHKVTYERDPLQAELPLLETRLRELLTYLLQNAFVVELQPSMPTSSKRPLVLRTASKFSVRARLLVRLHDRSRRLEAKIHIDRKPPEIRGFRKFNILTSNSKTLVAGDSPQDGLVCDFQHLTLKEQKVGGSGKGSKSPGEGPLAVTEELHLITFTLAYAYRGLELELETSTLPVIIISNNNQLSSAWASILWFNMLSTDPKNQQFFVAPPSAPWPRLAEVLSWQFESVAERGLSKEHLHMLAEKLFGSKPSPESTLAWPKFSKVSSAWQRWHLRSPAPRLLLTHSLPQDSTSGFSFWAWLDGILGLLQEHLKQLWKDGLILGFVSRKQEKKLLKGKRTGTFLIRFSESTLGGVTCTWVEHPESGSPAFRAVVPYTASELASLALPDIIHDYQLLAEENIPENPLQFLYPDRARDEAFGPYYSQRQAGSLMEKKEYLNQRLIRVSSRQANESRQADEELVAATQDLQTLQLQPSGPGPLQPMPCSPGTLQLVPGGPEPPLALQVGSGVPELLQPGPGAVEPQLVLQLVPEGQGMLQVGPRSLGTLQMLPRSLEMLQPVPGVQEMQQVGPGDQGTLQAEPGAVEPQLVLQLVPEGQGMLQVGPSSLGTLQVLPRSLEMLQPVPGVQGMQQVGPGDQGTLQLGPGTLEPSVALQLIPEGQGTVQVGPGSLEPLQPLLESLEALEPVTEELDMQEFLQSLSEEPEPGSGVLETLQAAELMPSTLEAGDSRLERLSPRPARSAALLDHCDPFLPQADDAALPAMNSLFAEATDFPPLHIDPNDFQ
ncbi:signal transducer and activator of transcription 2 isoform X2 [Rhea pennata]|uniref:signal transducer and activator of transcription 2 isoform X2 n=1 Tax=Rhea pennata TaxID=8795 RepID=UPI002E269368